MSRSGYHDALDILDLGRWRGMVASATRGKRGQALFHDLLAALDAMPEKRLIAHELEANGEVCALGAAGRYRHIDMTDVHPDEPCEVSAAFDIAECLAQEIAYANDECGRDDETPERRWIRMRAWVVKQLKENQSE